MYSSTIYLSAEIFEIDLYFVHETVFVQKIAIHSGLFISF